MPYRLPTFNVPIQAKGNFNFALGVLPVAPFIKVGVMSNLMHGRRVHLDSIAAGQSMYLAVPNGTGLKGRGTYAVKNGDAVEVPMGSGRWYSIISVDFVALGFTNQYELCEIVQPYPTYAGAPLWP